MHHRRQWGRGVLVAVATVALGVGATPIAAHASGGPKIVVMPSADLVSGQTVHVAGSGFPARTPVAGVECPIGATDPNACDLNNAAFATSDGHGGFTTTFVMHRTLLGNNGLIDCAPKACELLFALQADFSSQATAPVKFDPSVPLPPTSATVTPATNLADGQVLKVGATGFKASPQVFVTECVVAPFGCAPAVGIFAHPNGSLTTKFAAHRTLVDLTGTRVDCASAAGTCEMLVIDLVNVDYHATAPLAFNPNLPPPPAPSMNVHPSTELPYYARVTLYGKHWTPGDFVIVSECQTTAPVACATLDFLQPDNNGVIQAQPMLERELVDDFNPGGPPIDCAKPHADCALVTQSGSDGSSVTVPLTFDPHAPIPPKPAAHVRPAGPYHDQQVVNVTGRNFAPRAAFNMSECAVSASEAGCLTEIGGAPTFTGNTGSLSGQFQLFSALNPGDPGSDCTVSGVQCFLEVASEGGAVVDVPLTFAGGAATSAARSHARFARVATSRRAGWVTAGQSGCVTRLTNRPLLTAALRTQSAALACSALRRAQRG